MKEYQKQLRKICNEHEARFDKVLDAHAALLTANWPGLFPVPRRVSISNAHNWLICGENEQDAQRAEEIRDRANRAADRAREIFKRHDRELSRLAGLPV